MKDRETRFMFMANKFIDITADDADFACQRYDFDLQLFMTNLN